MKSVKILSISILSLLLSSSVFAGGESPLAAEIRRQICYRHHGKEFTTLMVNWSDGYLSWNMQLGEASDDKTMQLVSGLTDLLRTPNSHVHLSGLFSTMEVVPPLEIRTATKRDLLVVFSIVNGTMEQPLFIRFTPIDPPRNERYMLAVPAVYTTLDGALRNGEGICGDPTRPEVIGPPRITRPL